MGGISIGRSPVGGDFWGAAAVGVEFANGVASGDEVVPDVGCGCRGWAWFCGASLSVDATTTLMVGCFCLSKGR